MPPTQKHVFSIVELGMYIGSKKLKCLRASLKTIGHCVVLTLIREHFAYLNTEIHNLFCSWRKVMAHSCCYRVKICLHMLTFDIIFFSVQMHW